MAMNFFVEQERARRLTRRMLVLFAIAVAVIVLLVDVVVLAALGARADGWHNATPLVVLSLGVLFVIGLGSLYRIATLHGGGGAVARGMGARQVTPETTDFAYRRLHNVVEELAIAAGVPVPEVFVLEDEPGINAFAAGYTTADAAVTVTRGSLDKLTREELQGVIGHEFSHVLNGDMRLNLRLMGIVFGIMVLAIIGRRIAMFSGGRRSRDSGNVVLFGLALLAIGWIGVLAARIIKASVSRQREYLADASAVQFTRQTEGIAGALKKIGALSEGSRLTGSDAEEVSHMLFGEGLATSALLATHPPLHDRIRRLDPAFRDEEFASIAAAWESPATAGPDAEGPGVSMSGFVAATAVPARPAMRAPGGVASGAVTLRITPAGVSRQVGRPGADDHRTAQAVHADLPPGLRDAAYRYATAPAVLLALLLDADPAVRGRQCSDIRARVPPDIAAAAEAFAPSVAALDPGERLPLVALAFPALRRRPRNEIDAFTAAVRSLVAADGETSPFEYCLGRMLEGQVIDMLDPAAARPAGARNLAGSLSGAIDVFAVMASWGNDDPAAAMAAFDHAIHEALPGMSATYAPPADWRAALDRALPKLDGLVPADKERVVRGLVAAISADGQVNVPEAELLRAACAALHCPLPIHLPRGSGAVAGSG